MIEQQGPGRLILLAFCGVLIFSTLSATTGKSTTAGTGNIEGPGGILREIRIGIFIHDVDYLWSNMHVEDGLDLNAEILFTCPRVRVLSGILFPNLGITINDRGNTSKGYLGFLWEWMLGNKFFLDLGLGAAIHNGKLNPPAEGEKLLGCRVLFRIPFELGVRISRRLRLSIMFSHISNGYTAEYNEGLDVLGLRLGYCFNQ